MIMNPRVFEQKSNQITNEYMKFMYVYPRRGITDADIKLMLLEKIKDMTPDQKAKYMKKYKKAVQGAVERGNKAFEEGRRSIFCQHA